MNSQQFDNIDEKLSRPDQEMVRASVKALPEEMPSMAWRSQLNEKILQTAKKQRSRQRLWWIFTPSIGFAAAAALTFVMLFHPPVKHVTLPPAQPPVASSLEDSLVGIAADSTVSDDVTGSGMHLRDVSSADDSDNSGDSSDS